MAEAEPPAAIALPVQGPVTLAGRPQESFFRRLSLTRAATSHRSVVIVLIGLSVVVRCWHIMSWPAALWLLAHNAVAVANIAWQRLRPVHASAWRELPCALLGLSCYGLGLGWRLTRSLLDDYRVPPPSTPLPASSPTHVARHLALLLFASGSTSLAAAALSFRTRFSIALPVWIAVAATAVPFRGLICAAPVLSHPRAQRATHALFGLLGMLSHMLPLPLTPWVTHTPAEECAALLTFMQWSVGTAVPLLVSGFQEARLFQFHQLQRWQAGLPLESGWQASIYDFLWWISLGGSLPHTLLIYGAIIPACWDFAAFFASGRSSASS